MTQYLTVHHSPPNDGRADGTAGARPLPARLTARSPDAFASHAPPTDCRGGGESQERADRQPLDVAVWFIRHAHATSSSERYGFAAAVHPPARQSAMVLVPMCGQPFRRGRGDSCGSPHAKPPNSSFLSQIRAAQTPKTGQKQAKTNPYALPAESLKRMPQTDRSPGPRRRDLSSCQRNGHNWTPAEATIELTDNPLAPLILPEIHHVEICTLCFRIRDTGVSPRSRREA